MILHDREVRMAFPVGAMQDISELCPGRDIRRIAEIFNIDDEGMFDFGVVVKLAAILSYWGEEQYAFFHKGYEANPLTEHELMLCTADEIRNLFVGVMDAINFGNKTEIETETPKKDQATTETR